MSSGRRRPRGLAAAVAVLLATAAVFGSRADAQAIERVTFEDAVRRAITSHPTVQRSAADILRAQAVLEQVRSRSLPSVGVSLSTNVIDPVTQFSGSAITPRAQTFTGAAIAVPLYVPVAWAERNQAGDDVFVSERSLEEARRQIAIAAGEAYLGIIAQRRVVELNQRALENARAHFVLAQQRFEGGIGSRLNAVRARQEVSTSEALVEESQLAVRRAQEALGVLIAADGPVDAEGEPAFETPPATSSDTELISARGDHRVVAARARAAQGRAGDAG
jgi:outer membrane protein TolC